MKKEKGQGLVEFALILPFLLVLVVGIVEMGVILNRQITVVNAAREGARFGAYGAEPDAIYAQTLLATSQMFEFTEENAVVTVIHAETNLDGTGFAEWITNTHPITATVPYVTQPRVLAELQEGIASVDFEDKVGNLKLVVVDVRYDHESVLGLPFVGALADLVSIGSWTVMRVSAPRVGGGLGCCALPITLPIWDVEGLSRGEELTDVRLGDGPGHFGWLFWRPDEPGAASTPILARNLLDRCRARNFRDACDGNAELTSGSWVWGDSGEMMGVEDEVEALVGGYYPIPVWDEFEPCNVLRAQGRCNYCVPGTKVVHIVGFALMEITEVYLSPGNPDLPGNPKTISAKFRGWYGGCDG